MKFDDTLIGAVLGVFSIIVFSAAQTFPPIPGQQFGASLFPSAIAAGLFVCAVLLVVQGLRRRAAGAAPAVRASWMRDPVAVMRFALVPAALVFYFAAGEFLGFLLCAVVLLLALFRAFGVAWRRALPVAVVSALVIHSMFYSVLHVPLPWGVLEPIAW